MTDNSDQPNISTATKAARLSNGAFGPEHVMEMNCARKESSRAGVAAAIERLTAEENERFPNMTAILAYGEGVSKNRIYDNQDLMHDAQTKWNDRERRAGRPTRKLRGGDRHQQPEWVATEVYDATRNKLAHALGVIADLRARNQRLSKANSELAVDVARLELGIYDELWPIVD